MGATIRSIGVEASLAASPRVVPQEGDCTSRLQPVTTDWVSLFRNVIRGTHQISVADFATEPDPVVATDQCLNIHWVPTAEEFQSSFKREMDGLAVHLERTAKKLPPQKAAHTTVHLPDDSIYKQTVYRICAGLKLYHDLGSFDEPASVAQFCGTLSEVAVTPRETTPKATAFNPN